MNFSKYEAYADPLEWDSSEDVAVAMPKISSNSIMESARQRLNQLKRVLTMRQTLDYRSEVILSVVEIVRQCCTLANIEFDQDRHTLGLLDCHMKASGRFTLFVTIKCLSGYFELEDSSWNEVKVTAHRPLDTQQHVPLDVLAVKPTTTTTYVLAHSPADGPGDNRLFAIDRVSKKVVTLRRTDAHLLAVDQNDRLWICRQVSRAKAVLTSFDHDLTKPLTSDIFDGQCAGLAVTTAGCWVALQPSDELGATLVFVPHKTDTQTTWRVKNLAAETLCRYDGTHLLSLDNKKRMWLTVANANPIEFKSPSEKGIAKNISHLCQGHYVENQQLFRLFISY